MAKEATSGCQIFFTLNIVLQRKLPPEYNVSFTVISAVRPIVINQLVSAY